MNNNLQHQEQTFLKKKKKNKKGKQTKCNICLSLYKSQNLDKHMHGYSHHAAIENLKGGDHTHKCWACEMSVVGLEHFKKHIETKEHNGKLVSLMQRRLKGFAVDYSSEELNALCAQRDQLRLQTKQMKNQKKNKRRKERKAAMLQKALNQNLRMTDEGWGEPGEAFSPPGLTPGTRLNWSHDKSVPGPFNNENQQERMNEGPFLGMMSEDGGWNTPFWQTSQSTEEDMDFSSDQHAYMEIFSTWQKHEAEQTRNTTQNHDETVMQAQKRSHRKSSLASPLVKKRCLRGRPSLKTRVNRPGGSVHVTRSTSDSDPHHGTGLDQSHMDHLAIMLKDIRKSMDKAPLPGGSSEDPDRELTAVTSDGLNRDEREKLPCTSFTKRSNSEGQGLKSVSKTGPKLKQGHSFPVSGVGRQGKPEPTQTRHVLPTLLSRSVSKTDANKPNLKVARGIRMSQKPNQAAESRVLKPALHKLISSKSSQWRYNWKEIYEEATNRRLQRAKGMPRFGIELVSPLPPDPQGLEAEDLAHFDLDEGFQWASIECDPVSLPFSVDLLNSDACRQKCEKTAEATNHTSCSTEEQNQKTVRETHDTPGMSRSSDPTDYGTSEESRYLGSLQNLGLNRASCIKAEKSGEQRDHSRIQCGPATEINKAQEKQDGPEALNKNLPKNQLSKLLVMSLKEDELSHSLEDVDARLVQAQAVLQSAFMEVQRLQMMKHQVTVEMSFLRSKRIEILQGIKNSRIAQTPDADARSSAVQTDGGVEETLEQRPNTAPDHTSNPEELHTGNKHQRQPEQPDLSAPSVAVSEATETHTELPVSPVTDLHQKGTEVQPSTSPIPTNPTTVVHDCVVNN